MKDIAGLPIRASDRWMWTLGLLFLTLPTGVLVVGCDSDDVVGPGEPVELVFTFEEDAEGWEGAFADYSAEKSADDLDLVFDRLPLPGEVADDGWALFLSGRNESDDLFMFLKRAVTGLEPNTTYEVDYEVVVASNAPSGCAGIGGAPGESVYMKVGAAPIEPEQVVQGDDYRLNVDKGNQAAGGAHAIVVGVIANGIEQCTGDVPYRLLTFDTTGEEAQAPLSVTTDANGTLWLFVGTDSGFEGTTALYYDSILVRLEPVSE